MAANSPYESAAMSVSRPVTSQTTSNQPGEPTCRAMIEETMKMPEPIIEPATSMVESSKPSPRTNFSSVTAGVAVMLSFKRIYPLACRVPSRNLSNLVRTRSMDYLFDVELADALLHSDVFDGVPNSIGETEFLRYCID